MDYQEYLTRMRQYVELSKEDPEAAHCNADALIAEFLVDNGFDELAELYDAVEKLYS